MSLRLDLLRFLWTRLSAFARRDSIRLSRWHRCHRGITRDKTSRSCLRSGVPRLAEPRSCDDHVTAVALRFARSASLKPRRIGLRRAGRLSRDEDSQAAARRRFHPARDKELSETERIYVPTGQSCNTLPLSTFWRGDSFGVVPTNQRGIG